MLLHPPTSTLTDPLLPYTTRFRSPRAPPTAAHQRGCTCFTARPPRWHPAVIAHGRCRLAGGAQMTDTAIELLDRMNRHLSIMQCQMRQYLEPSGRGVGFSHDNKARADQFINDMIRSEEHTSELQSLLRISYAVLCLKKKTEKTKPT